MSAKPWFSFTNKGDTEPVEIFIFDQIGEDWFGGRGVTSLDFANQLKAIPKNREIEVLINSPGGNVWEGLAIYHQLRARGDMVTCKVQGVAASIASVIAVGGHRLEMPANSMMMIHDVSGMVMGTSEDMRDMADALEKHAELISRIYAEKTGKTAGKMLAMMKEETWFTGTEAKAIGLCDDVTDEMRMAANFDFSNFRRTPDALREHKNTADKELMKKIVALLKKHGVEINDDASAEAILAAYETILNRTENKVSKEEPDSVKAELAELRKAPTPPATVPTPQDNANIARQLADVQNQLRQERELRIRNDLSGVLADRPHLGTVENWFAAVLKDESILTNFRASPTWAAGTEPLRQTITNVGLSLFENYKKLKAGAARAAMRNENYDTLRNQMGSMSPRNVNTIAAALLPDSLADALIVVLHNRLASLKSFSSNFTLSRVAQRGTIQVRKATAASAVQTNPTDFETGDTTLTNVPITVNQISKSWHVTNNELNSGHRLTHLAEINANTFADGISDIWTALLIAANYATPLVIGVAGDFVGTDLAPVLAAAKNFGTINLMLDGGHAAFLLPANKESFMLGEQGAFGFGRIGIQNRWTGAVANTVGFVNAPNALLVASGLPEELPKEEFLSLDTVTIDGLELTVQTCHWFALKGRVHWASIDVMFGAAVGDGTAAEILVTA